MNHAEKITVRIEEPTPQFQHYRFRAMLGFFVETTLPDKKGNDTPKAQEEATADARAQLIDAVYGPLIKRLTEIALEPTRDRINALISDLQRTK